MRLWAHGNHCDVSCISTNIQDGGQHSISNQICHQIKQQGHSSLCVHACRITHVISILSASQLHFLANRNPELAGRTNIGEHVPLLSGPTHSCPQTTAFTAKSNEKWAWGRGWALLSIRYTVPQVTRGSDGSELAQTTTLQLLVSLYLMKVSVSKWICLLTNIPYEVLRSLSGVDKMLAVIVVRICTLGSL